MGLLDGDLAQQIYDGFKGRLLSGIIRQSVPAESGTLDDYGDDTELVPTDTDIEGFHEDYDDMYLARAGIPANSVKINIFTKSCPSVTPTKDDIVRLDQGGVSTWYQIRRVRTDPAKAMWVCPDAFVIAEPS